MRKIVTAAVMGAALLAGPLAQARRRQTPDQQLAGLLKGRVADKPVSCIQLTGSQQSTIIRKTAIVYEDGATLYVNRPSNPDALDDEDDILVTVVRGGNQLCSIDTVQLVDRTSHFYRGFVALNDFVPYRKVSDRTK